MLSACFREISRLIAPGNPVTKDRSGMLLPDKTTELAAIRHCFPKVTRGSTVQLLPSRDPSPTRSQWTTTQWPTVT